MTRNSAQSPRLRSIQDDLGDDCQMCAVVSYRNGESPLGTADPVNEWLFVEVPRPWRDNPWQVQTAYGDLVAVVESLAGDRDRYFKTRLQAIAPDRRDDQATPAGMVRVIYYRRPGALCRQASFSQYIRREYCLPLERAASLVQGLLFAPAELAQFEAYLQPSAPIRDLFICTHGDYDAACGRFGAVIYRMLQQQSAGENVAGENVPGTQLRVWQVNHFGGHQFAPTLLDFPTGRWWGHVLPDSVADLVQCETLPKDRLAQLLQAHYRGWSGAERFAQYLEQALWQEFGPSWRDWDKSAQIQRWHDRWIWQTGLRPLLGRFQLGRRLLRQWNRQAVAVTVSLELAPSRDQTNPQTRVQSYQAKVTRTGAVITQKRSGATAVEVPQYRLGAIHPRIDRKIGSTGRVLGGH
jgi:hypothetical protein